MTRLPPYHVLDFFHDEENSCALTVLVSQTRFHIIADANKLQDPTVANNSQPGSSLLQEYSQLLSNLKKEEEQPVDYHESRNRSTDSGIDVEDPEGNFEDKNSEADPRLPKPACQEEDVDAEKELHQWLLAPLASAIRKMVGESEEAKPRRQTLEEWYHSEILYFSLQVHGEGGKLEAVDLGSPPDLRDRISQLRPRLTPVPKYIRDIDVAWYSASDLELVRCSESPPPYHPSIVELVTTGTQPGSLQDEDGNNKKNNQKEKLPFFFKTVNNLDPQPTKREIKLLHQIAKKGLHDKIRCPRLVGIVTQPEDDSGSSSLSSGSSRRSGPVVMGFLQTLIPDPTPLTEKFDSGVPQAQRERWAREAEHMKNVLHENGIVWGDAKGDNFVVDAAGELWIIDFGGSYTEGWVDPDVVETRRGDDMGVEKVVNALRDPEENVAAPNVEDEEEEGEGHDERGAQARDDEDEKPAAGDKRKKSLQDEKETGTGGIRENNKRRRGSVRSSGGTQNENSMRYCYCDGPSAGTMIGCDGRDCEREWFHLECTNLESLPEEEEEWFCRNCEV